MLPWFIPYNSLIIFGITGGEDKTVVESSHHLRVTLHHSLQFEICNMCIFNHTNEQARKALESALIGKKNEYDKWDKEIKRKEELGGGGGGAAGGGGGGWFGWFNDDHFWQEAKRACLTILGILLMYLLLSKSNLLLAIIFNPLLYALRAVRNGFGLITSKVFKSATAFAVLTQSLFFRGFQLYFLFCLSLKRIVYKHVRPPSALMVYGCLFQPPGA
ncbi:unnamed protein product [Lupinus luteus]|uniref:Uncharacterized protein n=1 Tax=Lupinus luteus TaxID=3873 RepID=A0AAV1XVN6_LUPLU